MRYCVSVSVDRMKLPLQHVGVVWEHLKPTHADQLAELLALVEESEGVPYRTSRTEIDDMFSRSEDNWSGVAGFDRNGSGKMLAFGYVGISRDGLEQAVCQGGVDPSSRGIGIGSSLLEWQTKAGAELVQSHFGGGRGRLTHTIHERNSEFLAVLESLGYVWEGSATELRIPVRRWCRPKTLPALLDIVPWAPELDDGTRRAFNLVNGEISQQSLRASKSDWAEINAGIRRDWSFVALNKEGDRPRVSGFISVGGYEQDWEALGWREGVLQIVAALDTNTRDSVLEALIDASVEALLEADVDKMSVTLDPTQDEATMKFYRDRGFEVSAWFHTYSKPLDSGAEN